MSQRDLLLSVFKRGAGMLPRHLADLSDEDLFARPTPGANHIAWQLAHVAHVTGKLLTTLCLNVPPLPKVLADAGRDVAHIDDPDHFPTKAEYLEFFDAAYAAMTDLVEMMSDEQLSAPLPGGHPGGPQSLAFHLLMQPMHMTMHIGQIQVIRRALKKPVLF